MPQKPAFLLPLVAVCMFFATCKKNSSPKSPESSGKKGISAFAIISNTNSPFPNIFGKIVGDSIYLPVPQGMSLTGLTPTITYSGVGISPATGTAQNFNVPVIYTVTAADGSSISYTVVPEVVSDNKNITSFIFRAADNPGLSADLAGLVGADTIVVYADSTVMSGLTPTIAYTGVKISPVSGVRQDFSNPVTYTVTAEDAAVKRYTVILTMNRYLYVGSYDGNLYALDAATGNMIWKFASAGAIESSPTLYNGIVYFISSDTYAYAVNAMTGVLQWKSQLPQAYTNPGYGSNPTVQAGIMYFNAPYYLVALDATTGSLRWQTSIDPWSSANSPTVVNGVVYNPTINSGGPIVAFNALSGSRIRNFSVGAGAANPAVVNGIVYGNTDSAILGAWDVQTGIPKTGFSAPILVAAPSSPTLYRGNVYIGINAGQFGSGGLLALDANTGVLRWRADTLPGEAASSPVAGSGLIFAFDDYGFFRAFDAGTGVQKWSTSGPYGSALNATIANGTLYFGAFNGAVYAVDALTGLTKWGFQTGGQVISGPCVVDVSGIVHHPTVSGDQQ
jgi:outer membrane protein assembly factor BamB